MNRRRTLILAALAISGLAAPAMAECRVAPDEVVGAERLPRAIEGRIALAFIAMINDGSADAVRHFETTYRAPAQLAAMPVESRIPRVEAMHRDFGKLAIDEVLDSGAGRLVLAVRDKPGRTIVMDFDFDPADSSKLRGVALEIGDDSVKPRPLGAEQAKAVVEAAVAALEREYVFPEVARQMGEHARQRLASGAYSAIRTETALARQLQEDFRSVSRDKHLRVSVMPKAQGGPGPSAGGGQPPASNYGFKKVEILDGNIGYVRLDGFASGDGAKEAATAAMSFVSGCDAVIFDMRQNGGGSPDQVRFITSYIYHSPTHLNSMIDRDGKVVDEFWTLESVPGKRLREGVPVYVLTSKFTFSGAEEFTYNLKSLARATVIGETTGGGAHPVKPVRIDDRFIVGVPYMRANNPVTKTNWEGTGVAPDVEVPADTALEHAIDQARAALAMSRR